MLAVTGINQTCAAVGLKMSFASNCRKDDEMNDLPELPKFRERNQKKKNSLFQ